MVKNASEALRTELALAIGLQRSLAANAPQPADFNPWSGGVIASLSSPALSMRLLLNGACVGKALGAARKPDSLKSDPLPPVREGMSLHRTRVSVELASCEIDIGSLQKIRLGDVVRLSHSLEEPMHVKVDGKQICCAYLGRRGIFKAVELIHADSADGTLKSLLR